MIPDEAYSLVILLVSHTQQLKVPDTSYINLIILVFVTITICIRLLNAAAVKKTWENRKMRNGGDSAIKLI